MNTLAKTRCEVGMIGRHTPEVSVRSNTNWDAHRRIKCSKPTVCSLWEKLALHWERAFLRVNILYWSDTPQVLPCIYDMIFTQYLKHLEDKYGYIKPVIVSHITHVWYGFSPRGWTKVILHSCWAKCVSNHVIRHRDLARGIPEMLISVWWQISVRWFEFSPNDSFTMFCKYTYSRIQAYLHVHFCWLERDSSLRDNSLVHPIATWLIHHVSGVILCRCESD